MSEDKTAEYLRAYPKLSRKLDPSNRTEALPSELFHCTKAPAFMAIVENKRCLQAYAVYGMIARCRRTTNHS